MRSFFFSLSLLIFEIHSQKALAKMQIAYFINPPENTLAFVANKDPSDNILEGMSLIAFRKAGISEEKAHISTGRLRVMQVASDHFYAKLEEDGSEESASAFPSYPQVMAGDLIKIEKKHLVINQQASERLTLSYFDLFRHPQSQSGDYEFSEKGLSNLNEIFLAFKDKRFSLLLIKAYTDPAGPSDANQIESYQRALAIKSYLVERYGFDPIKLVPLGLGEDDPIDTSLAFGHERNNRRIVFSVTGADK